MAIYHFSGQVMSKVTKEGKPKSPLACAAYRSGEALHDELDNRTYSYKRVVQPTNFILKPEHAPSWVLERERLWNEVNTIEKRFDSQFAREFNVALPVELSKEEQEALALDFCQTAFVDKGMVADIAIHRDDLNNPHFHVMLTMRPFNEDGTWGLKAKREYIFDENGNHVLDKKGKKMFRKVDTTDWNKKEVFESWRKLWADKANKYLAKNGIDERITHLSNEARGLEQLPTIHEGYVARKMVADGKESERIDYNKNVKNYNKVVSDLNKYKRQKEQINYENQFIRKFSPFEKKKLSSIAKELKVFVNYSNLLERKEQLKQWSKSIQFTKDNASKLKQFNRMEKESELIAQAEQILEVESERFIQAYYPTWDISSLETLEKIAIVEETISTNQLLNDEQIDQIQEQVYADELRSNINEILHNRFAFVVAIDQKLFQLNTRKQELENMMNISPVNFDESLRKAAGRYPNEIKELQLIVNGMNELYETKDLMEELYSLEMKKLYPNVDYSHLSLDQKETLIVGAEYYKQPITLDKISSLTRYSTSEQEELIKLLTTKNNPNKYQILKNKYPDFQIKNPRYLLLFKDECLRNINQLSSDTVKELKSLDPIKMAERDLDKSKMLQELNAVMDQQIERNLSGLPIDPGYLVGGVLQGLFQNRDFKSKKQFEEDLKRKSKKKNIHRDRGGYSL